jgi:Phage tail assembly chaperone proteins, E, or 41 or 14
MMKVKLLKPIEIDGQKITEINLELEKLTGKDILDADREVRLEGEGGLNPLYTQRGLMILASKVSGFIPDDLLRLSAPDFLEVTANVQNFLLTVASPDNTPSDNSEKHS